MLNSLARTRGHELLYRGRELFWAGLKYTVMLVFTSMSLFPAQALAFNSEVDLSHLKLVFELDPSLEEVAIIGIKAWPKSSNTLTEVLNEDFLQVRSSLAAGSVVRVLSTAYSSTFDQTWGNPFITASGERVKPGIMAANFLPLGTVVKVENETYTILDRMNTRYNDKYVVDIWKPSRFEALAHGARIVDMEIVSLP